MAQDRYLLSEKDNFYTKIEFGKWVLSKDFAEKLPRENEKKLKKLERWVASHMRNIKLPNLIIEVDNDFVIYGIIHAV